MHTTVLTVALLAMPAGCAQGGTAGEAPVDAFRASAAQLG
jgi:hypothetical protein